MNPREIQHLYWRAGFGISPDHLVKIQDQTKNELVDKLFSDSQKATPLYIDLNEFKDIDSKIIFKDRKKLREFIRKSTESIKDYNLAWLGRIGSTEQVLRERMTLFWANHFSCRDNNILFVQQFNNILRKYALGDLRALTKAVSKEPAMIKYLNNKQNVKGNPNENFARELMEIFTLGEGQYTEKDIRESARAFTGYFHTFKGEFDFHKSQHDYGVKNFLGKRGNLNGDDIIDIIFSKQECAQFICEKIYRYFVNDTLNKNHIKDMVKTLYPKYDIGQLMQFVFRSDWFYNPENIGTKIKSPIDLLVGLHRTVPLNFKEPKQVLSLQKVLGQVLLYPPNVAGWAGGKSWIDSNTILLRLRLPSILYSGGFISTKAKGEFSDPLAKLIQNNKKQYFKVDFNLKVFEKAYKNVSIEELPDHLIMAELNGGTKAILNDLGKASKFEFCIQLMSIPEYQMC